MDTDGFIAEGAGDNFLIVKDNVVISPEGKYAKRYLRDYLMNTLCKKLNIKAVEKNEPYDVYDADEAFVTDTPFCMLPVASLNSVKIGDGKQVKFTQSF